MTRVKKMIDEKVGVAPKLHRELLFLVKNEW